MSGLVFRWWVLASALLFGCANNVKIEPLDGGIDSGREKGHFVGNGQGFIYEYRDVQHRVTCWHVPGALSCLRDADARR